MATASVGGRSPGTLSCRAERKCLHVERTSDRSTRDLTRRSPRRDSCDPRLERSREDLAPLRVGTRSATGYARRNSGPVMWPDHSHAIGVIQRAWASRTSSVRRGRRHACRGNGLSAGHRGTSFGEPGDGGLREDGTDRDRKLHQVTDTRSCFRRLETTSPKNDSSRFTLRVKRSATNFRPSSRHAVRIGSDSSQKTLRFSFERDG